MDALMYFVSISLTVCGVLLVGGSGYAAAEIDKEVQLLLVGFGFLFHLLVLITWP